VLKQKENDISREVQKKGVDSSRRVLKREMRGEKEKGLAGPSL